MGVPPVSPGTSGGYECSFKILLIGDSGVGKSSLLVSFVAAAHLDDDIAPTIDTSPWGGDPPSVVCFQYKDTIDYAHIRHVFVPSDRPWNGSGQADRCLAVLATRVRGVDFKIKFLTVGEKKLKLTIWDTAGQERFRTITSSYYRGAQGIILVYDVAKRESFTNLGDVWTKEIDLNSSNKDCIKMLVGNKVDKDDERTVTREEGLAFAQESGCLFLESSAKTRENVESCFEQLVLKILEVPSLLEEGSSSVVKRNILKQQQESHAKYGGKCCQ
ncbi:unnamed protein product [Alopecurus aequalis]